jgi:hypothetical protein
MTEEPAPPVETTESTLTDRTFLYQSSENFEAPGTWTADAACPAEAPVPYTLTSKAETLLGADGSPTAPLPNGHACGMSTRPAPAQPGPSAQPCTYVTEISMPPSDSGIHRLHARMKEPEPEPEAGQ